MYDDIAKRVYVAMRQTIDGNGNCYAARNIGAEIIRTALVEKQGLPLHEIPDGWRLYTVDASIEGRFVVVLKRSGSNEDWWHSITKEEQDCIDLHVMRKGVSFSEALRAAIKATKTESTP